VRDFGVTRTSGRTGLLTRAEVLESMRYTAPELVLGRPATPATDVYELAAVAVWCLTGAPPYLDRAAAEYVLFRAEAPPPVLALADGTPAGAIDRVLSAAMAVDPLARPSPSQFAAGLTAAVAELPAAVRDAPCPLRATEVAAPAQPAFVPATDLPAIPRGATRAEHRRPLPPPESATAAPTPWATYAACAMAALTCGLAGLLVGRAKAPKPPAPITVGAFRLDTGDRWKAAGNGDPRLAGVGLRSAAGEQATVGVIHDARLPGDPVPAALLPAKRARPHPARSGVAGLVTYVGGRSGLVARPTTKGTLVALCPRTIALGRCAALVVRARGPGRGLVPLPFKPVSDALRQAMISIEQATGIASAELGGKRDQQSGAAGRLSSALQQAASGLQVEGVDPGTGALLAQLRKALVDEAGALDDLGGAIDRQSDVAFDAATDLIRASRRKLTATLAVFRRAGYPVSP
ncbi:MAG: eukaryotic-like serine/threonine-protein kinase, partial [Solirubrobacteraceae bacterium]|jgi:hypothetical protein|nr:eukaryotic-like serine/threonine-protein kinase [Solirubrobacteraceae bacterium]